MIIDYEILKLIWWLLVGILLIGFAITDGFDMGAGALLPFLGRNDEERRVIINTVGPHWDGNQVWFITAGGAIFAAWPAVYTAAFSGFYIAMLLVLFALFFRPVGFDYRSKIEDARWQAVRERAHGEAREQGAQHLGQEHGRSLGHRQALVAEDRDLVEVQRGHQHGGRAEDQAQEPEPRLPQGLAT